jgi:hypothetical protein
MAAKPTGRPSERTIRSNLASIGRAMKDKSLSHKTRLEYLKYDRELRTELKAVTKEKLDRQLRAINAKPSADDSNPFTN